MRVCLMTTNDNPFSPLDQFDEWYFFDIQHGYNTCGIVARLSMVSNQLTKEENSRSIEQAIDEFVDLDFTNTYKKLVFNVDEPKELEVPELF